MFVCMYNENQRRRYVITKKVAVQNCLDKVRSGEVGQHEHRSLRGLGQVGKRMP